MDSSTGLAEATSCAVAELAAPAEVVENPHKVRPKKAGVEAADMTRGDDTEEVRQRLLSEDAGATEVEKILIDLAVRELPLVRTLEDAKLQLAQRLLPNVESPKAVLHVARLLKETVSTSNAISKRVEHILGSLTTLRSQRHLLEHHRGHNGN